MDKLLDKLSSYNLLNSLIPGSIFSYLLQYICSINIISSSTVENFFIYYFVGMVLSRIGSIFIEPLAKKLKLITYTGYNDYVIASKIDNKIDVLLETSNLYRTIISIGLLIIAVKIYTFAEQYMTCLSNADQYIILIALVVIFSLSYKKQTKYIKDRVNIAIQEKIEKKEKENKK